MPSSMNLDRWLKPSTTPKRKRDDAIDSDMENPTATNPAPHKKAKPTPKPKTKLKIIPSANTAGKEAKKLYTDSLKAVDKDVSDLDKEVKAMNGNSRSITTASYATSAGKHIKTALTLAAMDPTLAFNLILSLADASHTDLDASCKMSGTPCDSTVLTFKALDNMLSHLMKQRERAPRHIAGDKVVLPPVPARWTQDDADVGPFKTGRPNKQQRGQMYTQKLQWEKQRTAARRARREAVADWVAVALADLKEERDYLDAYGVEDYMPKSIARLEELAAAGTGGVRIEG